MRSHSRRILAVLFCILAFTALPAAPAHAQGSAAHHAMKKHHRRAHHRALSPARRLAAPSEDSRFAALVVDANTNRILYEVNANAPRHPASLTKMLTLYLLFDALKHGRISMNTLIPISAKAAHQPPTNMNLTPGDRIPVRTAIECLIVRSANDVAMAVAEALGGSQEGFARMMNAKARQLGMTGSYFVNPSGLPDNRQITTADDMARIGIALRRDFPEYFGYFALREFYFRNQVYPGHNRLLGRYPGADGMKTGFIGASGFNLVTSVHRGNTRLIGVIMGGRTAASRDQQMMNMLDRIFAQIAARPRQASQEKRRAAHG